MQRRRSSRPIRWWLATFGSAVAFPFILLLALMFIVQIRDERTAARTTALRVSRAAADRLVGLRSDSLALLRHMASRPSIQSFESQPCDSLFAIVDFFPQYVNLFLFDRDGRLHCAATPQDARDRAMSADAQHWLEQQLRRGRPQFEKLTIQQSAGQWMSTIAIPLQSGATLAVVALPEVVAKEALPPEAVVTILDRNGTVLARSADPTRWTGRNTRASGVTQLMLQRKEGTAESTGIDGVSRQYGFTFVPELGWYIYVGIPTSVVMGPVRKLYFRGLVAGVLVIFVAVFVAVILSRRVERPINQLAAGASSVARGEYDKVESTHRAPLEITMLADAFNEMVDSRSEAEQMMEEDDLGQSLTALKMDILGLLEKNNIPPSPTSERIQRTLDSTVSAVQQISMELRPSMLDDLGLMPALEAEVRLFEERSGVECELSVPDTNLALDAASSTVLYRIVQEALTNVARHSNATRVEIRLRHRRGEVLLEIRDDGRGITAAEVSSPTSLGLMGIRERAAIIGGTADFEGIEGRGTIVSVRIPIGDRVGATS